MKLMRWIALVALVPLMATTLVAESIVGEDKFICAVVVQEVCAFDQPCTDGGPTWDTKIPEFVEFNVKQKTIGTTAASGRERSSKVDLRRDDGLIIVQAYEAGKVFSFVINESMGIATAAVIADGEVITVFAICTPQ
jgi:hypothetical protein